MRRHPTSAQCSTAAADSGPELISKDAIALNAEAAAVLARIVREHLNQRQPLSAPSADRHTSAAH